MLILQIVNRDRKLLAEIRWESPSQVNWQVFEADCEADLKAFVERAKAEGVPFRTVSQILDEGQTRIAHQQVIVKPDDERFLRALSDMVMRYSFGGQRAFGLLKKDPLEERI
jgi:hypothetical protein